MKRPATAFILTACLAILIAVLMTVGCGGKAAVGGEPQTNQTAAAPPSSEEQSGRPGADFTDPLTRGCGGNAAVGAASPLSEEQAEKPGAIFTDPRDGRKYRTVKIGNRVWMAENLNFKMYYGSSCHGNDESNCRKYGQLYKWNAAMKACPAGWRVPSDEEWDSLALAVGGKPVKNKDTIGGYDWEAAGAKLKSKTGWGGNDTTQWIDVSFMCGCAYYSGSWVNELGNGTDDFGFSALPGGYHYNSDCIYDAGSDGYWWSATEYDADEVWVRSMHYRSSNVNRYRATKRDWSRSLLGLRCIEDSAAVAPAADTVGEQFNPDIAYGSFIDERDGKTYRTTVIGRQRWMAENLNFKIDKSSCYGYDESNCQKYGRLYNWHEAVNACPAGWRVPSDEEWATLAQVAGGRFNASYDVLFGSNDYWEFAGGKLKSTTGWNNRIDGSSGSGSDSFGFSALPGGSYLHFGFDDVGFGDVGNSGSWWSATEVGPSFDNVYYAWQWRMDYNLERMGRGGYGRGYLDKSSLLSLRCVEDSAALR